MAIVVNNPSGTTDEGSNAAGLIISLAIVVVLVLGAIYLLPRIAERAAPAANPGANINVTLPTGGDSGAPQGTPSTPTQ